MTPTPIGSIDEAVIEVGTDNDDTAGDGAMVVLAPESAWPAVDSVDVDPPQATAIVATATTARDFTMRTTGGE